MENETEKGPAESLSKETVSLVEEGVRVYERYSLEQWCPFQR